MLSIGEMARRSGVKVPTIRYYEQMGLIAAPERSSGNQRRYTKRELDRLTFIRICVRSANALRAFSALKANSRASRRLATPIMSATATSCMFSPITICAKASISAFPKGNPSCGD